MADLEKLTPKEGEEQATLFHWAEMRKGMYPELALMFHIPNEGKRSRSTGGRMVKEGLKAGVPDIFLPVPRGGSHGLFIEMKRRGGKAPRGRQADWHKNLREQGYTVAVAYGWAMAADILIKYLEEKI